MRPASRSSTRQETKAETKPKPEPKTAAPATRPSAAKTPAASTGPGGQYFTIQTGSFNDQSKAARAAEAMRKKGIDAEATQGIDTSGKTWNVVRVGKFSDRKSAGSYAAKLKAQDKIDGMIVKVGGKGA